jgi:hypothetical protein
LLIQAFGRLGQDHHGFLSPGEVACMDPARRERLDENHDGQLSQDKFFNGYIKELTSKL